MEKQDRIFFFHDLIRCFHNLCYWIYDANLQLQSCTSADAALLHRFFYTGDLTEQLSAYCSKFHTPVILTSSMHTSWLAAPEKEDGTLLRVHVFGPFFPDNASLKQCEEQIGQLPLTSGEKEDCWQVFRQIPVVFANHFTMYTMMLHFCLTGERRSPAAFPAPEQPMPQLLNHQEQEQIESLRQQHELERQMIRMIGDGNLDYRKYIEKIMMISNSPSSYQKETLRQTKNRTYARAGLVAEAVIDGGVDPEIALPMLYQHLQNMEDAGNIRELARACCLMEEDFARQVYRRRTAALSKTVLDCCDYIQLHLDSEDLSRAHLAKVLNYSEGYLSRRFKQEMGITIKDYVTQQRLERSKELLRNSKMSIQDISAHLHFGSHSHFAAAFKKAYGTTPKQWRDMPQE